MKDNPIHKVLQSKIIECIWKEFKDFIFKFICYLDHDKIIKNDLNILLEEFRKEFKLSKLDLNPGK